MVRMSGGGVADQHTTDVSLQVMVPSEVKDQLRHMAARENRTHRSIVLEALKRIGIKVPDGEIHDRRKTR